MILLTFAILATVLAQSDLRPASKLFQSDVIEEVIRNVTKKIKDPKLKYTFINSFPNTLDTTVLKYSFDDPENPDAFIITGDIHAMWLRDSTNQIWTYIDFIDKDPKLRQLAKGLLRRQILSVLKDPYANAFNYDPKGSEWAQDNSTRCFLGVLAPAARNRYLHERKFETDSLSAVLRLAKGYFEKTKDQSIFDFNFVKGLQKIIRTFHNMQVDHKENADTGQYFYTFQRRTSRKSDTVLNGIGVPVKRTGLLRTFFRASDDSTLYQFNIPENALASTVLKSVSANMKQADLPWILRFASEGPVQQAQELSKEISDAIYKYGVKDGYFVYELDGKGVTEFMDDSNQPSLLSLPIIGFVDSQDPIYLKTRAKVLSLDNPWWFSGSAGSGVGGPHIGDGYIWPMAIVSQGMTSNNKEEVARCLKTLVTTTGGRWFMHESFYKDNANQFTRSWFAWANGLFGEFVLMVAEKYPDLLEMVY